MQNLSTNPQNPKKKKRNPFKRIMYQTLCEKNLWKELYKEVPEHLMCFFNTLAIWDLLDNIEQIILEAPCGSSNAIVSPEATIDKTKGVYLSNGVIVEPGAFIQGPCWIGENSIIRQGAYIRGYFYCGHSCVIGHATEVKNSIWLNHTKAPHFSYVGDSILGSHVNLGAGVILANLRLDRSPIKVRWKKQVYQTNRKKFGSILGDGVQIGCNSVLNPGVLASPDYKTPPLSKLSGYLENGSF